MYYFNTKELTDNKFGTPNPIPFRVVDLKIGLDVDVSVRCSGVYSYKIDNPLLFYANVCGNVEQDYMHSQLDSQLKTEFISALQPAFGKLSDLELRPNQIVSHNAELEEAMNMAFSKKWGELRGLKAISIALGSVTLPQEDADMIKQLQRAAVLQNPNMAGAMKAAAWNGHECRRRHECPEFVCHGPAAARVRPAAAHEAAKPGRCMEMFLWGDGNGKVLLRVRRPV